MRAFPILLAVFLTAVLCISAAAQKPEGDDRPPQEKKAAREKGEKSSAPKPGPKKPAGLRNIEQVQLQVFITEMSEQGLRDVGANLSYTRFVRGEEQSGSLEEISTNLFNPSGVFGGVSLPVPREGGMLRPLENNFAGFGLSGNVLNVGYGTIDFLFRGIERKADIDIISKPELLVQNGLEASISAGGEVPYQAVDFKNNKDVLSVKWEKVGVDMRITPVILSNGMVMLNIKELTVRELSRFDKVRGLGLDLPVFSERTQRGNVMVPNGRTLVIGGLTSEVIRKSERRVPVLGKLPIIGMGFRSRQSEADFTTLVIFVSPTIVDVRSPSRSADSALNFWRERDTDWTNEARIDEELEELQHRTGTGW